MENSAMKGPTQANDRLVGHPRCDKCVLLPNPVILSEVVVGEATTTQSKDPMSLGSGNSSSGNSHHQTASWECLSMSVVPPGSQGSFGLAEDDRTIDNHHNKPQSQKYAV